MGATFTYTVGRARRRGCEAGDHDRRRHRPPGAPVRCNEDRRRQPRDLEPAGRSAAGVRAEAAGRGTGGRGGAERPVIRPAAGEQQQGQGFGGRGGPPQGPLVGPGRYRATLGRQSGERHADWRGANVSGGGVTEVIGQLRRRTAANSEKGTVSFRIGGCPPYRVCASRRRTRAGPSALIAVIASAIIEPTSATLAGSTSVLLFFASSPNCPMYCSATRSCTAS